VNLNLAIGLLVVLISGLAVLAVIEWHEKEPPKWVGIVKEWVKRWKK
jgi:hypothetical protein